MDPADHRIQLVLASGLGEVAAELVEHLGAGLLRACLGRARKGCLAATLVAGEQLEDGIADAIEIRSELDEHRGGDALTFADEAEQDVLGADVVVVHLQRLAQRELEHLLGARGERHVTGGRLLAVTDDLLNLLTHRVEGDPERFEGLRGDALTFVDEAQQDVFRADVAVIQQLRLILGKDDHATRAIGKPFEHPYPPIGWTPAYPRIPRERIL